MENLCSKQTSSSLVITSPLEDTLLTWFMQVTLKAHCSKWKYSHWLWVLLKTTLGLESRHHLTTPIQVHLRWHSLASNFTPPTPPPSPHFHPRTYIAPAPAWGDLLIKETKGSAASPAASSPLHLLQHPSLLLHAAALDCAQLDDYGELPTNECSSRACSVIETVIELCDGNGIEAEMQPLDQSCL